jgi:glycosyltransferase involved in cell wall biosynthesis
MESKKKICFVVAVSGTANFLRYHIVALKKFYDVFLVANINEDDDLSLLNFTGVHCVSIHRKISILNDIKAVYQLYRYFRKMKFDAVHSITPKAGLIASLAAFFAMVPVRVHIFTGQVWATRKGPMRWLLMLMDKITATLDNHILTDGESQRQYIIKHHIVSEKKSIVLGDGSISGVNLSRFEPKTEIRKELREELHVLDNTIVYVFLGRLNHDKGIYELLRAFNKLAKDKKNVFLLLVGWDEENCMASLGKYENIYDGVNFKYYGPTPKPENVLQGGDIFCLPTYREGFGTSVLEASCLGIPVICSDAYGVMDAMVESETGLRCKVGNWFSLYNCMKQLYDGPVLRKLYGENARKRVLEKFSGEIMTQHWVDFYKSLLG